MSQSLATKASKEKTTEQGYGQLVGYTQRPASAGIHGDILDLQRSAGNQAVNQALKSGAANPGPINPGPIQGKLTISQPGDRYEQEADRIADQVMRIPEPDGEVSGETPSVTSVQTQSVQRDASSGHALTVTPSVQSKIEGLQRSGGEPLPERVRTFMEPKFGQNFNRIRIHTGPDANKISHDLNARSLTVGNNIVFGPGELDLNTYSGQHILAHELVHALQQYSTGPQLQLAPKSKKRKPKKKEKPINLDDPAARGRATEPSEIELWKRNLRDEGFTELFDNNERIGWVKEAFRHKNKGPDLIAINHKKNEILIGDVTSNPRSATAIKPGEHRKLPHGIGGGPETKPHLAKTVEDALQAARNLPDELKGFKVYAQDWWSIGKLSKRVLVYRDGRFLVGGEMGGTGHKPQQGKPPREGSRGGGGKASRGAAVSSSFSGSLAPPTPKVPRPPPSVRGAAGALAILTVATEIIDIANRDPIFARALAQRQSDFFKKWGGARGQVLVKSGSEAVTVTFHEPPTANALERFITTWEDYNNFTAEALERGLVTRGGRWVLVLPKDKTGNEVEFDYQSVIEATFQRLEQNEGPPAPISLRPDEPEWQLELDILFGKAPQKFKKGIGNAAVAQKIAAVEQRLIAIDAEISNIGIATGFTTSEDMPQHLQQQLDELQTERHKQLAKILPEIDQNISAIKQSRVEIVNELKRSRSNDAHHKAIKLAQEQSLEYLREMEKKRQELITGTLRFGPLNLDR